MTLSKASSGVFCPPVDGNRRVTAIFTFLRSTLVDIVENLFIQSALDISFCMLTVALAVIVIKKAEGNIDSEFCKLLKVWAKVVAPLNNTMCLVNDDVRHTSPDISL